MFSRVCCALVTKNNLRPQFLKMSFENKVVLVTGSGSGIGKEAAILFAKEGADVVIVDYNEVNANKTAEKCKQFGRRVLVIPADLSTTAGVENAIYKTIDYFSKLDVLINNAGIIKRGSLLAGTMMDSYDDVMNTNLRSVVHMTSLATPYLIKSKGCIVNTSSLASIAERKGAQYPVYTLTKVGVDAFTRLSALELAPSGVRVNAVNPGPTDTKIMENSNIDGSYEVYAAQTPLKKGAHPREVADLIVYLASDKASSITGSLYLIDNGMCLV